MDCNAGLSSGFEAVGASAFSIIIIQCVMCDVPADDDLNVHCFHD